MDNLKVGDFGLVTAAGPSSKTTHLPKMVFQCVMSLKLFLQIYVRCIYTTDCHICDLTWPHMTSSHSLHDMILHKFLVSIFLKQRCVTILHSSVIKFLPYFPVAYVQHSLFHFYFLVVQYRSNSAVFNNDESMFCSNSWVIKTHSKFYNLKRKLCLLLFLPMLLFTWWVLTTWCVW